VCGCLGTQIFLFGFELTHLAHDAFTKTRMGCEALVEISDLLAKVFLFELKQRLGIALFYPGDEERQETPEQIPNSAEHAPSATRFDT
jgi:hypothetical protein